MIPAESDRRSSGPRARTACHQLESNYLLSRYRPHYPRMTCGRRVPRLGHGETAEQEARQRGVGSASPSAVRNLESSDIVSEPLYYISNGSPNHSFVRYRWPWSNPIRFHYKKSRMHENVGPYCCPGCGAFDRLLLSQVRSAESLRHPKSLRSVSTYVIQQYRRL